MSAEKNTDTKDLAHLPNPFFRKLFAIIVGLYLKKYSIYSKMILVLYYTEE